MNLLDDSLSADLARSGGGLDATMHARFAALTDYAIATGASGVLFTCSAFGACIEHAAARHPLVPVLKPNAAMIDDAVAAATAVAGDAARVGLIASFAPTLSSMPVEFPRHVRLECELVEDAMRALDCGELDEHDALVASAALRLRERGARVIALAQFSMARAAEAAARATGLPVFTTPDSAVRLLKRRLAVR